AAGRPARWTGSGLSGRAGRGAGTGTVGVLDGAQARTRAVLPCLPAQQLGRRGPVRRHRRGAVDETSGLTPTQRRAAVFQAAPAAVRPRWRCRYTSSSEIAAGVTPAIRIA